MNRSVWLAGLAYVPDEAGVNAAPSALGHSLWLWWGVALAVALSSIGHALGLVADGGSWLGPIRGLLDLDGEGNLPTWFASALLLFIALKLWESQSVWTQSGRRAAWRWGLLALIAAAMSAEEIVGLHERTVVPLRRLLGAEGVLHFAWVIPGIMLVGLVAALGGRLAWSMPAIARSRMALGVLLYLLGAIGMELIAGPLAPAPDQARSAPFLFVATIEETLEMCGLVVSIGAIGELNAILRREREPSSKPILMIELPEEEMIDLRSRAS